MVVTGLGRRGYGGGGSGSGSGLGGCWVFRFGSGLVVLVTLAALRMAYCSSSLMLVAKIAPLLLLWTIFARSNGIDSPNVIFNKGLPVPFVATQSFQTHSQVVV